MRYNSISTKNINITNIKVSTNHLDDNNFKINIKSNNTKKMLIDDSTSNLHFTVNKNED